MKLVLRQPNCSRPTFPIATIDRSFQIIDREGFGGMPRNPQAVWHDLLPESVGGLQIKYTQYSVRGWQPLHGATSATPLVEYCSRRQYGPLCHGAVFETTIEPPSARHENL